MNATTLTLVIAWVFLIGSWILPFVKKGSYKYKMVAFAVSAISFGMFLTYTIYKFL